MLQSAGQRKITSWFLTSENAGWYLSIYVFSFYKSKEIERVSYFKIKK